MGGIALLARQLGFEVTGSDQNVYPPMSTQLEDEGIELVQGFSAGNLEPKPDLVVIGNALSRGNPEIEAVLNLGLPYTSGPAWLSQYLLQDRWVLAAAGTHGKTTTSSMLAWIMEDQGLNPGFLIGGVPKNFGLSARLGHSRYFVVEADEYDTAFFDKRSKFVHYLSNTLILNNLEYDHADIFPDMAAIKTQFHHLVRTVPGNGLIIVPDQDENLSDVLKMGCWTPVQRFSLNHQQGSEWRVRLNSMDASDFQVFHKDQMEGVLTWELTGLHNVNNALSAIAAAHHIGIHPENAIRALTRFQGVKRRMEICAQINGVTLYDDFAHHPTAITSTLEGLRHKVNTDRIIAILEPRSNTMRLGVHKESLAESLESADLAIIYQSDNVGWDVEKLSEASDRISIYCSIDAIIDRLVEDVRRRDHLVFMSNGSFAGIHQRVATRLKQSQALL